MNSVKRGNKFMFILLLIFVIGSLSYGLILGFLGLESNSIMSILVPQIGFIAIPVILYFIITKESIKETLRLNKLDGINLILVVLLGFFIQPLLTLINVLSQLFATNYISETIQSLMSLPYFVIILLTALLPSVTEEVTTRGILLANYKNINLRTTAIMSGIFFGMFHLNINQFSYAFVMGIILCLIVEITDSIYASMIIHFIINGTQVTFSKLAFYFQDFISKYTDTSDFDLTAQTVTKADILALIPGVLIFALLVTPVAALLFYLAVKYNKKAYLFGKSTKIQTNEIDSVLSRNELSNEKVVTPYLIASITLFISFVVVFEFIFV